MAADAGEGEAPVASGVMLARAYASGHLDLILVSGEFEPRWALSSEDAMDISDYDAAVLECLHLQESPVWAGQKLCPSLVSPALLCPFTRHLSKRAIPLLALTADPRPFAPVVAPRRIASRSCDCSY
jgi:hypothetical protein